MEWIGLGSCRKYPPETFFPSIDDPEFLSKDAVAKSICAGCPVVETCREYAIDIEPYGTWGGMNEIEREEERKNRGLKPLFFWAEHRHLSRAHKRLLVGSS